jgi:hypothetical protein
MPCHRSRRQKPQRGRAPFRDLNARYPIDSLGEALAEGILTGQAAEAVAAPPASDQTVGIRPVSSTLDSAACASARPVV